MIVESDTSALSALLRVGEISILEKLYGQVIIPSKVYEELMVLGKFGVDTSVLDSCHWIEVLPNPNQLLFAELSEELDEGEAEAISLAVSIGADILVIDEYEGRKVAARFGLRLIGVGGILLVAKEKGIIKSVKFLLDRIISETKFRLSSKIYADIISLADESNL